MTDGRQQRQRRRITRPHKFLTVNTDSPLVFSAINNDDNTIENDDTGNHRIITDEKGRSVLQRIHKRWTQYCCCSSFSTSWRSVVCRADATAKANTSIVRSGQEKHDNIETMGTTMQRRFLVLFISISIIAIVPLRLLYTVYETETKPSPFLPSRYNYLPSRIQGVAPPFDVFVFPTPQERVRFYMGDWSYFGPNGSNNNVNRNVSTLDDSSRVPSVKMNRHC